MSTLESSVTLDDVFSVVEGKRVPLAPELAGYLTLEVADGTEASGGAVDPRTVYISEEGTVALVRPKKDGPSGDAETSVRAILAKLLEASGSATPALMAAARKRSGPGLLALVAELEGALIPVNRAAGRRALARLAREVKRVTLGVGRNASMPPPAKAPPSRKPAPVASVVTAPEDIMSGPDAPPGPRASMASYGDEAQTARGANLVEQLAAYMNAPEVTSPSPPPPPARPSPGLPAPPARAGVGPHPRGQSGSLGPPGAPERGAKPSTLLGGDEVDSLLSTFEVSSGGEKQMRTELKAIAGVEPTPGPPDAMTLAELTKDIGKDLPTRERHGDSVESLLAFADTSIGQTAPPALASPPAAPSATPFVDAPSPPLVALSAPMGATGHARLSGPQVAQAVDPSLPRPATPPRPQRSRQPAAAGAPEPAAAAAPDAAGAPARVYPEHAETGRTTRARKTTGANFRQPRAPRTGLAMLVLTLFVFVAGGISVWMFRPAFFTGKKKPLASATASASPAVPPAPRCKVALVVSDVPANAEILLRMGPAPLDVDRMPVGARLEFVATAEGYMPRRAVIKAAAPWEKGPDGKPRIDVPIQLDPSKAKPRSVDAQAPIDPWPVAEPGSQVGGTGSPGTVHVVSNVRGAEVWLLAGLGPEARIEQLRCDGDIDVLLAGPPLLRKRLHVAEKDIQAATADARGNRVLSLTAK